MMLIVILMNKVKVHLIYVRNQQLAGFKVRQVFTLSYVIVIWLYVWNCLQALKCKDGARYAIFVLQISFMVLASIGSAFTAKTLSAACNFGYQRRYRKQILSDEIMIQTIIISNLLLLLYPCFAFHLDTNETLTILIFIALEVAPLSFILYTLFKELGVLSQLARFFRPK